MKESVDPEGVCGWGESPARMFDDCESVIELTIPVLPPLKEKQLGSQRLLGRNRTRSGKVDSDHKGPVQWLHYKLNGDRIPARG